MTVKEELRTLIDRLDEEQVTTMLVIASRMVGDQLPSSVRGRALDVDRDTLMLVTTPMTEDDPFWSAPPIFDEAEDVPTDMSTNKHKYLAEAYGDLHDK